MFYHNYIFNFEFNRVVIAKFVFKDWFRYDSGTSSLEVLNLKFVNSDSDALVPIPLPDRCRSTFWKSNFSKTIRQNFKVNVYSERAIFTLLENVFTIKFCRVIFEKFDFQKVKRER